METYIPHLIAFIAMTVIILLTVVVLGAIDTDDTNIDPAWKDIRDTYTETADSSYDMLVIMVIIGVAGLILLLMKIEF